MDVFLPAAADAMARRNEIDNARPKTPAEEDSYYARHTLNVIVPAWMLGLVHLLRRRNGTSARHVRAARHA